MSSQDNQCLQLFKIKETLKFMCYSACVDLFAKADVNLTSCSGTIAACVQLQWNNGNTKNCIPHSKGGEFDALFYTCPDS